MIAILASGNGSNFEAIVNAFPNKVTALLCNKEDAYVLERAKHHGIACHLIPHKNYKSRDDHEKEMVRVLASFSDLKLIVLAGYMRILSESFFERMELSLIKVKMINLHPAHLDQYKGAHAYEYAVENKFPAWGLSIHEVTPQLDSGKLLNSIELPLLPYENVNEFKNKAQHFEHKLLVETINQILK